MVPPTYDAENRIVSTGGVTYTYDGDGERVKKSNGTLYWTGTGSAALLETTLDGTAIAEYVFFNGKRIARIDRPSAATHYYLSDHIGSTAKVTNATGTIEETNELGAYGEPLAGGNTRYLFTGKERDIGGEDYFGARYYAFRQSRFLTPDWSAAPVPVPYAALGSPQTLNLYAYVQNNPITGIDPEGHLSVDEARGTGGRLSEPGFISGSQMDMGEPFGLYEPPPAPVQQPNPQQVQTRKPGRQPDGSYWGNPGPGSEIAQIDRAADAGTPVPLIGSGECVALVSHLTQITEKTTQWTRGPKLVNADGTINSAVLPGTAVSTFDANGRYPRGNVAKNSGTFLGPGLISGPGSIRLMDQWNAHPPNPANPPQSRDVRFYKDPTKDVSNNSNAYYVIIVPR